MMVREPVVAGRFYESHADTCRAHLDQLLCPAIPDPSSQAPFLTPLDSGVTRWIGGLVPHAGWSYSGAITAKVFRAIAAGHVPHTVVLFGGVHRCAGRQAAMFVGGEWETPLGRAKVDDRLAERLLGHTNLIVDDAYAHEDEHSIEVQIPFVQHVFPDAKILPIMVPPIPNAHEVGEAVARTVEAYQYDVVVIGTTDLTHYGPAYGFTPHGRGAVGHRWAREINDRRFIDLVIEMRSTDVVAEAALSHNACSAGAVAATLRAVMALGATTARLLAHTSSSEVAAGRGEDHDNSVGYAGVVFG